MTCAIKTPVAVLGFGVEGRTTVKYLKRHNVHDITVLDARDISTQTEVKTICGEGYTQNLEQFATVFKSPGFRPDAPFLESARQAGTIVTSAVSHFMEHCPCPVIAVTGTVGKGTACSIAAYALEESGRVCHLGGNIGKNPLDFLDDIKPTDRVVLEISSFQAMDISKSPQVGGILKTTTEHLDWHTDTDEYRQAKSNLFAHQTATNFLVVNADSPGARIIADSTAAKKLSYSLSHPVTCGLWLDQNSFFLSMGENTRKLPIDAQSVALKGRFNLENIAAGILLAYAAGGNLDTVSTAAAKFVALPHRLELAAADSKVDYYNDSYATRPDAAMGAIDAFEAPLALVMGGSEKNADFTELFHLMSQKNNIASINLIGATADRMATEMEKFPVLKSVVSCCPSLKDAMHNARTSIDTGVVLMAPACASFGMFKNYKDRGEQFRAIAQQLAQQFPTTPHQVNNKQTE